MRNFDILNFVYYIYTFIFCRDSILKLIVIINNNNLKFSMYLVVCFNCIASITKCHTLHSITYPLSLYAHHLGCKHT